MSKLIAILVKQAPIQLVLNAGFTVVNSPATVTNSDDSYTAQVAAGGALELPDITVSDENGENPITFPAAKNVQVSEGFNHPEKSGIHYSRPIITFEETSYAPYDAAWYLNEGDYDYTPPVNPTHITSLFDFWTLLNDNVFGSKQRWTGTAGGYYDPINETYHLSDGTVTDKAGAFPNWYAIDHYTGLGWYLIRIGTANWATQISRPRTTYLGLLGHNDWRCPTINEYLTCFKISFSQTKFLPMINNYLPSWSCETYKHNTGRKYQYQHYMVGFDYESVTKAMYLVRNHFT